MDDQHSPSSTRGLFDGASPKLTLLFGLVTGIAAMSLLAMLVVVPRTYQLSRGGGGSSASTATAGGGTSPAGTAAGAVAPEALPSGPSGSVKPISKDDHVRGGSSPQIYLVEYSDFECPFCKRFHPTMQQALEQFGDKVAWVYRHFPLSFHANAAKEAEAAECANELGGNEAFWKYTDEIFKRTTSNGTGFALDELVPLAKELGLNDGKFKACLDSGKYDSHVNEDLTEGTSGGVQGTPTTFLVSKDGKTISSIPGAYPFEQVKQAIEQAL